MSIILPTRDRPALVGRALASALAQTFADLEVLLVDGNRRAPPVRENPQLVAQLADARVRVIDGRAAHSAATARNAGLAAARGGWIAFLDDDDEYRPEKIAAQHALATAQGAPLVLCGYEFVWPRRRRVRQVDCENFRGDELLARANLGSPLLFHRREPALRFDPRLAAGEDVAYALRFILQHRLHHVPNVPRPLVVVHPQPDGASVHADKEAVWRAYRATWPLARQFSRRARRAWLAHGRLERAMGGHGSAPQFVRRVIAVLRTRGLREWRFALYAVLARRRRRAKTSRPCPPTPN